MSWSRRTTSRPQSYCDTVTIVADGTVVAQGEAAGLLAEYDEPTLEGVFLAWGDGGTRACGT